MFSASGPKSCKTRARFSFFVLDTLDFITVRANTAIRPIAISQNASDSGKFIFFYMYSKKKGKLGITKKKP